MDFAFIGVMYLIIIVMFVVTLPFKRNWKKSSQFGVEL
jgi:hypothetical protein